MKSEPSKSSLTPCSGEVARLRAEHMEEEFVFLEPAVLFDPCVVGLSEPPDPRVIYDADHCIAKLMEEGASHESALESFYFNVAGASGPGLPIFVWRCDRPSDRAEFAGT